MRGSRWLPIVLSALLALSGPAQAAPVKAGDYDAYWLWAGVTPTPVLKQARSLYILQGQVDFPSRDPQAPSRLIAQGGAAPRVGKGEVWIVYRVHTLNWSAQTYKQVLARVQRWHDSGVPVAGVQIDFDSATRHLDDYEVFLRDFRRRLPVGYRLSITGLLDWSTRSDSAVLNRLSGVVDEIVLQTYQGRRTIPGYAVYLKSLDGLKVPFRIGLAEGGDWTAPAALATNPRFRGYVVFLLNPRN